ncbi:MAG: DUF4249 domain-containing protein [Muribaculaceae bacterium]|nr:DUF4249 domain-containing protein [Muribaculaceae bacterium]
MKLSALSSIPLSIAVCAAFLFGGCSDGAPALAERKLVAEGWIDSGGYPVVLLTLSAVPQEEAVSVAGNIVRWGVVSLSDGERTIVLTGGPSDDYFPPFRYYSYEMAGVPGRTYTLTAEYEGRRITSSVTMPEPTPILSAERTAVEAADTLSHIELRFRAPEDLPACYHVSYMIQGVDRRFLPSMLGALEVREAGAEVRVPVYRSRSSFSLEKFQPEMPADRAVTVKLERVAPEVFRFWRAFDDATLTEGSAFVSGPGSLPSNIIGGLGVFSAAGTSTVTVPPLR